MQWTLGQLAKMEKPINVNYTLDLSASIDLMPDVKEISLVEISGQGYESSFDEYIFSLDIKCTLTMACAVTLEDVIYPLNIHTDEMFAVKNEDGDDINLIEGNTINLDPVILANVIMSIPMKVVIDGAEDVFVSEEEYESTPKENPAFADLEEYLKK